MSASAVAGTEAYYSEARSPSRRSWAKATDFLGTFFTFIAIAAATVLLVAAIATRFSSSDEYTLFGHPALIVLSGSMTPTIDTGDFVVDNPDPGATNLRVGQIMTFFDSPGSSTVLTHRIIQVVHTAGGVFYRTKGDANPAPDPDLRPARDVIGVYDFKIPRGGYFLVNLHRPIVLGLLLAAPVLWLVAGILRSWAKDEPELTTSGTVTDGANSMGGLPQANTLGVPEEGTRVSHMER